MDATSELSTKAPVIPGIFVQTNQFTNDIYVALHICNALTALSLATSIAALAVLLCRKDQRRLVKKTAKPEGTYFLPHSPILAPLMITCYCIVGIATSLVLKQFIWKGSATVVIQRLSLLLPMPLLLWAWLSAFSNAFAWHLTPQPESRLQKLVRFKPRTLNCICWLTPLAMFAVQIALVAKWPIAGRAAHIATARYTALAKILDPADPILEAARLTGLRLGRVAEMYYQGCWAMWSLSYGACWVVYTIYSSLLLSMLSKQAEVTSALLSSPTSQAKETNPSDPEKGAEETPRPSVSIRRASANFMRRTAGTSERSQITKRELLRRNTRLVALEFASFSVFTIAWCLLASVKAAMGNKILNNPKVGPITVVSELYESTVFSLVAVTLLLIRGINILRSRKGESKADTLAASQTESRTSTETSRLAARRGRNILSIPLNIGDFIVVSSSEPATPASGLMPVPELSFNVDLSNSTGPSSGASHGLSTPPDGYFSDATQYPTVRRKSSVTFIDDLPQLDHTPLPRLQVIVASPVIPETDIGSAFPQRSETPQAVLDA